MTQKQIVAVNQDILNETTLHESVALIEQLMKKHGISFSEISLLLGKKERFISFPVGLFRTPIGPLEVIVRYMKDVLELKFSAISRLLSRDETTIWTSYQNSRRKTEDLIVDLELSDVLKLPCKVSELLIPLAVFSNRKLSILESLCLYLKDNFGLSNHTIAQILKRNDRTIWTVITRARKKNESVTQNSRK